MMVCVGEGIHRSKREGHGAVISANVGFRDQVTIVDIDVLIAVLKLPGDTLRVKYLSYSTP